MTDVSGVETPAPLQEATQVSATENTEMSTTIPAGSGLSQLPKELTDAIMMAIAQRVCHESQAWTDKIKKILREAEQK
jgi:hypothetical protein